ncbi:MAG: GNAT family N-acetyltransferase, partial [Gemmatimonadota bacterium]|nr:GNAT family N-acetyltransferase [Gemmatimonadota bacterium]
RFLGPKKDLTEADLDFFTNVVPDEHVGLVATAWEDGRERIVGVGRYMTDEPGGVSAEVAFTVLDDYQNRGIGTLLFEHLVELARERGVDELWADMWPDNRRMMGIFERSGYPLEKSFDGSVVRVHLMIG